MLPLIVVGFGPGQSAPVRTTAHRTYKTSSCRVCYHHGRGNNIRTSRLRRTTLKTTSAIRDDEERVRKTDLARRTRPCFTAVDVGFKVTKRSKKYKSPTEYRGSPECPADSFRLVKTVVEPRGRGRNKRLPAVERSRLFGRYTSL